MQFFAVTRLAAALTALATLATPFTASAASNAAPIIRGTSSIYLTVGRPYYFQPSASDANHDALYFMISGKPAWATFSARTGALSGTPTAPGRYANIAIKVTDGKTTAVLPSFLLQVQADTASVPPAPAPTPVPAPTPTPVNHAPALSGAPLASITAGGSYSFKPTATDTDGNTLAFSIANKPAWASFNTTTGQLTGTPTAAQVGSYSGITISVSDGKASAALAAFAVAVTQSSNGVVTLSWVPPSQNTDGSALTNLSGYRIYYGTSANALTQTVALNSVGLTTYVVENLSPATYYFAMTAVTSAGVESSRSSLASNIVN